MEIFINENWKNTDTEEKIGKISFCCAGMASLFLRKEIVYEGSAKPVFLKIDNEVNLFCPLCGKKIEFKEETETK